jgi:hypothetical protein
MPDFDALPLESCEPSAKALRVQDTIWKVDYPRGVGRGPRIRTLNRRRGGAASFLDDPQAFEHGRFAKAQDEREDRGSRERSSHDEYR